MRQIVLDTETTGLKPQEGHRVIEIGCLELVNRRITGKTFHHYINPEREIDAAAQNVHGITSEFLAGKPIFSDIAEAFVDFITGAELIIHNAPFDIGFLNAEFKKLGKAFRCVNHYCGVVDTLVLARHMHPGRKNNLDALCQRYTVDNTNRDLHGALLDAELLAQVYLLMTGGQTGFFDDESASLASPTVVGDGARVLARPEGLNLRVVKPTAGELAAHEAFIKELLTEQG